MKNKKLKIFAAALMISQALCISARAATYYDLDEIQDDVYISGQNREESYSFTYKGSIHDIRDDLIDKVKEAYAKDDYLSKSWSNISYNAKGNEDKLKITVNTKFITTKEQEEYVEQYLKNSVNSIINSNMSQYDKVKVINEYIKNKYSYDYDLYENIKKLNNNEITSSDERDNIYNAISVYSALNTSKAVCQGYSMTAYKMLKDVGIECRIISGTLNGSEHVWNKVKVNDAWLYLDVTANDTLGNNKFFLVNKDMLISNGYSWNETEENGTENV